MKYRSPPLYSSMSHPRTTRSTRVASLAVLLALAACSKEAVTPNADETTGNDTGETSNGEGNESSMSGDGDGDPTTTTATTNTTNTTDPTGFVPEIDALSTNTCDPAIQDCPDGEKCTGYVVMQGNCCVDANKCVEVIGNAQLGDPCVRTEDNDDCAEGLFCMTMTSGSTGDGVCLAFCNVATQDCADDGLPDANCISFNDGTLPLCQDSCDPITQDCDPQLGCYGVGTQGFACALPGYAPGQGNDGDECYTIQSCLPGLGCTAADVLSDCNAARCCSPYCDLSEPDPCTQPEECVPYYEPGTAPPGYENVGLCAVPA